MSCIVYYKSSLHNVQHQQHWLHYIWSMNCLFQYFLCLQVHIESDNWQKLCRQYCRNPGFLCKFKLHLIPPTCIIEMILIWLNVTFFFGILPLSEMFLNDPRRFKFMFLFSTSFLTYYYVSFFLQVRNYSPVPTINNSIKVCRHNWMA